MTPAGESMLFHVGWPAGGGLKHRQIALPRPSAPLVLAPAVTNSGNVLSKICKPKT